MAENRKSRQAKLKSGPGVFRYVGGAYDTACTPTVLRTSRREPDLDGSGMPRLDASGRQMWRPAGAIVRDEKSAPVLGGPPKVERIELDVCTVRRVPFALGEAVEVADEQLALKLRGMECFEEVDGGEPPKKKRGRPPKAKPEADASGVTFARKE